MIYFKLAILFLIFFYLFGDSLIHYSTSFKSFCNYYAKSPKFQNLLKYVFIILCGCVAFMYIDVVNAEQLDLAKFASAQINGTVVLNTENHTLPKPTTNFVSVASGGAINIKIQMLTYSVTNTNVKQFLNVSVCSTNKFEGVTDSSNVINDIGTFNYLSQPISRSTSNSCTVNGVTGSTYDFTYVVSISLVEEYGTGAGFYANSYLTLWAGGYMPSQTYISILSLSLTDYDDRLLQEIQTNQKLDDVNQSINDVNDSLTSTESPDMEGLGNTAGWLPAGPVDSILNLPLAMLNSLLDSLSSTCQPVTLPLPFVNKNLELPCINSIYAKIGDLSVWVNSIGIIISALILYRYLLSLYHWVDDTLSFRENNWNDTEQWGGI